MIYPLGSILLGLIFILVGFNDFYSLLRCKEKIDGVYCGYNTYVKIKQKRNCKSYEQTGTVTGNI